MSFHIVQQPHVLVVLIQDPLVNGEFATRRDTVVSHVTEQYPAGVVVDVTALMSSIRWPSACFAILRACLGPAPRR